MLCSTLKSNMLNFFILRARQRLTKDIKTNRCSQGLVCDNIGGFAFVHGLVIFWSYCESVRVCSLSTPCRVGDVYLFVIPEPDESCGWITASGYTCQVQFVANLNYVTVVISFNLWWAGGN
ncbi:hypothetical protein TNIN_249801 [Trichonephila inaurata madagascariensis]|uniref:Uncharacterized protein n=1 Tax=Trichonephila inaurata madagascariensis TaxID=2747483 RepID=A0A8X6MH96_9ARAC|nr:hypothetical protein TNIN_249801 [Trichonephila inaurata madagascariensis]